MNFTIFIIHVDCKNVYADLQGRVVADPQGDGETNSSQGSGEKNNKTCNFVSLLLRNLAEKVD